MVSDRDRARLRLRAEKLVAAAYPFAAITIAGMLSVVAVAPGEGRLVAWVYGVLIGALALRIADVTVIWYTEHLEDVDE